MICEAATVDTASDAGDSAEQETPWSPRFRRLTAGLLLTNLLVVAVAGSEIDRLGPARPYAAGIALFVLGLLIAGAAPAMIVLIAARAIQGVGSGILAAVNTALIGQAYPDATRPRMLALTSTAWVLPGLTGPAVAGTIADGIGWRWVFYGIVPVAALAALLVIPALPRSSTPRQGRPDWNRARHAALLAAGMAVMLTGLGKSQLLALPLIGLGLVCLIVATRTLLPQGTLRVVRGVPAALALMILISIGFYGTEAFIPLLLTDLRGTSSAFGGLALTASAMTWTAGSWVLERRAASVSRATLARIGLALIALGIAGVGLMFVPGVPVLAAPVAWAVAGLGVGLSYATAQLVTFESAASAEMGRASSTLQLAHTAAITLATGAGGAMIALFGSSQAGLPMALGLQGGLMLAATLLGFIVANRLSGPGTP